MNVEINRLRDFYGTYLLQHGILEAEINLLQGRIPPSIFLLSIIGAQNYQNSETELRIGQKFSFNDIEFVDVRFEPMINGRVSIKK